MLAGLITPRSEVQIFPPLFLIKFIFSGFFILNMQVDMSKGADQKVTLIDFGDAKVGPAEYDFEFLYYLHNGRQKFNELIKTNPGLDFEKIKFYSFFGQV